MILNLHEMARLDDTAVARVLLEKGVDVDARDEQPRDTYGESPLRRAVSVGRFDLVQLLLEAGVTPEVAGWSHFVLTLLFGAMAIEAERPEMLAWLLAQGVAPEMQDDLYRKKLVQIAITKHRTAR